MKEPVGHAALGLRGLVGTAVLAIALLSAGCADEAPEGTRDVTVSDEVSETELAIFEQVGLETDPRTHSIDLDLILGGGPVKDGIPSIDDPAFVSVQEADIADEVQGILVDFEGVQRYYPFSILVWHEVVNDSIGDTHFAVTFCPLCGSGVVFDRDVDGDVLEFGVSGLLYESNLLMYDRDTESLWSQSLGEAVVGEKTGAVLDILFMQLVDFATLADDYPDAQVLPSG
jgi:hypothetical protein